MTSSDRKPLAVLPLSCAVRRTSFAAGAVTALLTGGLPFVGFEPGVVMGRAALLPSPLAFMLHLSVAVIYGAFFCLVISRSRNAWTLLAATCATLALYFGNVAVLHAWNLPSLSSETEALLAHFVFGAVFTSFFKLAEIGVPEPAAPHPFR